MTKRMLVMVGLASAILATVWASSGGSAVATSRYQTVVPVPHQFTPSSLLRLDSECLQPYVEGQAPLRRQDKPRLFARNGPAVLAVRTRVLVEQKTLYGAGTRALQMTREDSIDIDDLFDLEVADLLMAARTTRRSLA